MTKIIVWRSAPPLGLTAPVWEILDPLDQCGSSSEAFKGQSNSCQVAVRDISLEEPRGR